MQVANFFATSFLVSCSMFNVPLFLLSLFIIRSDPRSSVPKPLSRFASLREPIYILFPASTPHGN
jgi:hypothetical protein